MIIYEKQGLDIQLGRTYAATPSGFASPSFTSNPQYSHEQPLSSIVNPTSFVNPTVLATPPRQQPFESKFDSFVLNASVKTQSNASLAHRLSEFAKTVEMGMDRRTANTESGKKPGGSLADSARRREQAELAALENIGSTVAFLDSFEGMRETPSRGRGPEKAQASAKRSPAARPVAGEGEGPAMHDEAGDDERGRGPADTDCLRELLSCPACLLVFCELPETDPVTLNCGHTVCVECYTGLATTARDVGVPLRCPECRAGVSAGIQPNLVLKGILASVLSNGGVADPSVPVPAGPVATLLGLGGAGQLHGYHLHQNHLLQQNPGTPSHAQTLRGGGGYSSGPYSGGAYSGGGGVAGGGGESHRGSGLTPASYVQNPMENPNHNPRLGALASAELNAGRPLPPPNLSIHRSDLFLNPSRVLGQGAFGAVIMGMYRGKPVAVKSLLPANTHGPDAAKMARSILREISIMSLLVPHECILGLVGCVNDKAPSGPLLVTELAACNLHSFVRDRRGFGPQPHRSQISTGVILRMLRDIAAGLAHLHAGGYAHRDLRPVNILLTSTDPKALRCKVSDFGLSKRARGALGAGAHPSPPNSLGGGAPSSPVSSFGRGADFYVAPEMIGRASYADYPVDMFAFGLIALELFTGTRPFSQCPKVEHLIADYVALHPDMPSPGEFPRDTPAAVADLAKQCWSRFPADRPTARAALARIETVAQLYSVDVLQ